MHIYLPTPVWKLKKWEIKFKAIKGKWGECDFTKSTIIIDPSLSTVEQTSVLLHECEHAMNGYDEDRTEAKELGYMNVLKMLLESNEDFAEQFVEGMKQLPMRKKKQKPKTEDKNN